jgi:hypothetical protein
MNWVRMKEIEREDNEEKRRRSAEVRRWGEGTTEEEEKAKRDIALSEVGR